MSFKSEIPLMSDAKISGTAINFRSFTKMVPMGLIQLAIKSPPPCTSSIIKPKVTPNSMPINIFQCKASDFIVLNLMLVNEPRYDPSDNFHKYRKIKYEILSGLQF